MQYYKKLLVINLVLIHTVPFILFLFLSSILLRKGPQLALPFCVWLIMFASLFFTEKDKRMIPLWCLTSLVSNLILKPEIVIYAVWSIYGFGR